MAKAHRVDATYYLAKDLDRAIAFYRDVLGIEPTTRFETGAVEYVFDDGTTFGLATMPDPSQWVQGGGVMFAVDNAHTALADAKQRGAKAFTDIMESPVCFMAWLADSEGNTFAVHQRK